MNSKIEVFYVLEYPDKEAYVDIDQGSGGYSYRVDSIRRAHKFANELAAKTYMNVCKGEGFILRPVIATVGDLKE